MMKIEGLRPLQLSREETPMKTISFDVTRKEAGTIRMICDRAHELADELALPFDQMSTMMDLTALQAGICKLRLDELLRAERMDFIHDVWGVRRHLNRDTGVLENHFLPRYAAN